MKVNHNELVEALRESVKGTGFVGSVLYNGQTGRTVKGKKIVDKTTVYSNMSCSSSASSYEKKMQKADADFEAGALPWGEWEIEGLVIKYKDSFYLRLYVDEHQKAHIRSSYSYDGELIVPSDRPDLFPPSFFNKEEKDFYTMSIRFDHIKRLNFGGEKYEVI